MILRSAAGFALALFLALSAEAAPDAGELNVLCYHDVRDDVRGYLDPDQFAVSTETLIAHLDWLTAEGYRFVRLDDVLAAREGKKPLPPKAVLLTFDDGYASCYTRVFPLLKLYDAPAVFALVGEWLEAPPGSEIDYGAGPKAPRSQYITWDQAREMQASGLVEMASHSNRSHRSIPSNPQDGLAPAIVTRQFLTATRQYETLAQWNARIEQDLQDSADLMEARLGRRPRAMVWPYGETNAQAKAAARQAGMIVDFTLGEPTGTLPRTGSIDRHLIASNEPVDELASRIRVPAAEPTLRFLEIRIDDWFLPDPKAFEQRLDRLIETARLAGPSQILLDVFAHDPGTGEITGAYLPGTGYPLRADVANRLVELLEGKIPAVVVARLPANGAPLISLSEALGQFLPLGGLAIPASLSESSATAAMDAVRRWRPEAKRYDWGAEKAVKASGEHFHLVMMGDPNLAKSQREIPFLDLSGGVKPASETLREWLRAGGRHTAAGPLTPETNLQNPKTFRNVISANANPYRESLIRKLQPLDRE
jgi:biofilm PGA synthesis lipoprotein PgaB